MTAIRVDPEVYAAASAVFGTTLAGLVGDASSRLESDLAGMSRIAGSDPAGGEWAGSYDRIAGQVVQAMDDLRRSCLTVGGLLEQSGFNHGRAEAHSDMSGATPVPPDATSYDPGFGMCVSVPSVAGGAIQPPDGWEWVAQACGAVWPDGDPAKLRAAGDAWRNAASTLDGGQRSVNDGVDTIRSQQSPEIEQASMVCRSLGEGMSQTADSCRAIAQSCDELADHIEKAHNDLIGEIESFLAWTAGIEAAGLVVGLFTAGIGEIPAQVAEGGRIAALVARVTEIVTNLANAVKSVVAALGSVAVEAISTTLKAILARVPVLAETRIASAAVKGLDGLATSLKLSGARVLSEADFDAWKAGLTTRGANYGSDEARAFQREVTGSMNEYKLTTADGSTSIWADGVRYDPKSGGAAIEAKFVENAASSVYEGSAPSFVVDRVLSRDFDIEMLKYARIINDPSVPVTRLDVVVSTSAAKEFLGSRMELLAQRFNKESLNFPYSIEVAQ